MLIFALAIATASPITEQDGRPQSARQAQQAAEPPAVVVDPHVSAREHKQRGEDCAGTDQPGFSCDEISAKAARDQAREAERQSGIAIWQNLIGFATLLAAAGAAVFAERAAAHTKKAALVADQNLAAFIESERPRVEMSLANMTMENHVRSFDIMVTNYGASGCVVTGVFHVWCQAEEAPTMMTGYHCGIAIPAGETKTVDPVKTVKIGHAPWVTVHLEGYVLYKGPFTKAVEMKRFRFEVSPEVSYPHMTWYRPLTSPHEVGAS